MKAAAFRYVRATSAEHAQALLAEHGEDARLLAGGQSLLAALNLRLSEPAILVDIGRIGHTDIEARGDGRLRLGALATHAAIGRSAAVAEAAPMLAQAVPHIAHPAIRNRGTIGGSLALGDPAAEWPACALALNAEIVLASAARGERRVPAEEFFLGLYSTACAADEMVLAIEVPAAAPNERQTCLELARRRGDYALVGVAARAVLDGGRVSGLRAAFFGVSATPVLAREASRAAEGAPVAEAARAAADALDRDLDPHSDPMTDGATRLRLARVLLRRAVEAMAA
jgi:carbon-monoxide dehydrogenase medium subunit